MSNTPNGGQKIREHMIKKWGSEEAWKEHMRSIGKRGGTNSKGYGFAHGKLDPRSIGKLGGIAKGEANKADKTE